MWIQAEQSANAETEKASKSLRETLGWWNWKEVKNKQAMIWDSKGRVPETVAKPGEELPLPLELSFSTLTAIPRALPGTKVIDGWAQFGGSQRQESLQAQLCVQGWSVQRWFALPVLHCLFYSITATICLGSF